ncbi:hypothetical protein LTSEJOH_3186, partial [Salmonella enterica subsp. enterica serovar Johannesburg str. S5-703]
TIAKRINFMKLFSNNIVVIYIHYPDTEKQQLVLYT